MLAAIDSDLGGFGVAALVLLLVAVVVLAAIAAFVFWLWMLISAVRNQGVSEGEKIAWVLVLVFLPLLGSILYFFIGHPKRHAVLTPR